MPPPHKDPAALEKMIVADTTPDDKNYHVGKIDIPKGDPPSDKGLVDFQKSMRAMGGTELQLAILQDVQDGKYANGKFDRPGTPRENPAATKLLQRAVLEPNGDLKIDKLTVKRDDVKDFKESLAADRPDTPALVSRLEREAKGNVETKFRPDPAKVPPLDPQVQAILKQIPRETMTTRNLAEYNEKLHDMKVAAELSDLGAHKAAVMVNGKEKPGPMQISGTVQDVKDKDGVTTVTLKDARGNENTLSFSDSADPKHPAGSAHPLLPLSQSKPGDKLTVQMDETGMNFATHTERDGKIMEDRRGPHASQAFGDPVAFEAPVPQKAMAHSR